jgi:hypothetical protein
MPTFFMRTYGQAAGFNDPWTSEMDTATLDVTPALIRLCRRRSRQALDLAAKDNSLWELHFWDPGRVAWWDFYPEELIESIGLIGAEVAADDGELVELADATALKLDKSCAVEGAQMRVLVYRRARLRYCEFGWGAYRKHTDIWVTTPSFTIADFEEALAKVAAGNQPVERNRL